MPYYSAVLHQWATIMALRVATTPIIIIVAIAAESLFIIISKVFIDFGNSIAVIAMKSASSYKSCFEYWSLPIAASSFQSVVAAIAVLRSDLVLTPSHAICRHPI